MRQPGTPSHRALVVALLCLAPAAIAQPRGFFRQFPRGPFILHSGNKCLDVNGPQTQINGARVQLWDCNGGPNQQWRAERGRIVSLANNRCLDVFGPDGGYNGARIQVWDCNGAPNQEWRFDQGRLSAKVDGRCLDVHGPDMNNNGAHVQTWDCHNGPNQQWGIEPLGPPPAPVFVPPAPPPVVVPPPSPRAQDIEAGPIWNQRDAEQKCPAVCRGARWTGGWRTTVPGRMSVCACLLDAGPVGSPQEMGPGPMHDRRFEGLLQAIAAESFSQGKIHVLEDVAHDHYFVIAQLRRIIEGLTFSGDKIRAVEIIAPRILDRRNAYTLYSVFTFETERQQARAIFDRLR